MSELKTLNGYEIVDAKARQDIAAIKIPSIEGLATEDYVDEAVNNSQKATTTFVSTYYYTKTETDNKIKAAVDAIDIPETDLTGYATEAFVTAKIAEAELAGGDDDIDLSGYALTSDIPTKVSQLQNDKGYLTEHQSLDNYITQTEYRQVQEAVQALESDHVSENDIKDFATKTYVDTAIENIEMGDVDLSNYYTKSEVENKIKTTHSDADIANSTDISTLRTTVQSNYNELLNYYIECHNRLQVLEATPSAEGRSY